MLTEIDVLLILHEDEWFKPSKTVTKKKLEDLGSREIVKWIFEHIDTIADSKEPYSEKDS